MIKQRGLMALAVAATSSRLELVGTNMLGVGLHSYGSPTPLCRASSFMASQAVLIGLASLPWKMAELPVEQGVPTVLHKEELVG